MHLGQRRRETEGKAAGSEMETDPAGSGVKEYTT